MAFDSEYVDYTVSGGRNLWQSRSYKREAVWSFEQTALTNGWSPLIVMTMPTPVFELERLRSRALNWDGRGGVPPRAETIQALKTLYWLLPRLHEPVIQCAGDGEVSMAWRNQDAYLELGVDDDGAFSYFGRANDQEPLLGDLDRVPDSLPESLVDFLGRYFHAGVPVRASFSE